MMEMLPESTLATTREFCIDHREGKAAVTLGEADVSTIFTIHWTTRRLSICVRFSCYGVLL